MTILDRFTVADSVALVTGASRGIGRASALALAEAGANVVVCSRSAADLEPLVQQIQATGRSALALEADVNELDQLPGLIEQTITEFGKLDFLVNNVGGTPPKPLLDTSSRMFERAFHFNVTTAFELSKLAMPHLLAQQGAVVNISSAIGRMTDRGMIAYGTAKAAMAHMTRLMATECAPRVRVNAIAVGATETSALETVLDDNLRSMMEAGTPLRRLGQPEDIAAGVLYLCSPAGSYLTGKVLEIDGGLTAPNLALALPDL